MSRIFSAIATAFLFTGSASAAALTPRPASAITDSPLILDYQDLAPDPDGSFLSTGPVALAAQAGIKWARVFAMWSDIEFAAGSYDFRALDPLVNSLQSQGIKVLMSVTASGGNTLYAGGNSPTNANGAMTPWLAYVDALAAHYTATSAWEIWNEPNLNWKPAVNAADYVSLAKQTSAKILTRVPGAFIVAGGTSMIDKNFTQTVLAGAAGSFNAIAFHPYRSYPEQSQDPFIAATAFVPNPGFATLGLANYEAEIAMLKGFIAASSNPGLQLWSTEAGFPSQLDTFIPGSYTIQAKNLARYYMLNLGNGVAKAAWYHARDAGIVNANFYNPAGAAWVDDYRNLNFLFGTFGVTYLAPGVSTLIPAPSFSASANIAVAVGTITATAAANFASYTVAVPQPGPYSLWVRLRSVNVPNPGATFAALTDPANAAVVAWTVNGNSFSVNGTTVFNYGSINYIPPFVQGRITTAALSDYYWMGAVYGGSPTHYYPIVFNLSGTATITIGLQNAAVSELRLVPIGALTPKPAGAALQWLAALIDGGVGLGGSYTTNFTNGTLGAGQWAAFRSETFTTQGGIPFIAYWTGTAPVDVFSDQTVSLALSAPIKDPILIDPLQGTYTSLGTGQTNALSLRTQDYPLILTGSSVLQALPSQLILAEETYSFPNPVRGGQTTLRFMLSRPASVTLEIYNSAHEIMRSVSINAAAGRNAYSWDVGSVANGVYFWKVSVGGQSVVKKALILR